MCQINHLVALCTTVQGRATWGGGGGGVTPTKKVKKGGPTCGEGGPGMLELQFFLKIKGGPGMEGGPNFGIHPPQPETRQLYLSRGEQLGSMG